MANEPFESVPFPTGNGRGIHLFDRSKALHPHLVVPP